jgi:Flp pilus assembly protein TadG
MYPYVRTQKPHRGQSLTELAISTLFFFIILFGALDIGRAYFIYVALEDSAGEAALYLAINPHCPDEDIDNDGVVDPEDIDCADPKNAEYRAENAASGYFDWSTATITVEYPTVNNQPLSAGVGDTVEVSIAYPFTLFTPIISQIVGSDTLTITSVATQTIMME